MSDVHNIAVNIVATDADGRVVACPPIDQLRAAMTLGQKAFAALPKDQRTAFVSSVATLFAKHLPAPAAAAAGSAQAAALDQALYKLQVVIRDEKGAICALEEMQTPSREAFDARRKEFLVIS